MANPDLKTEIDNFVQSHPDLDRIELLFPDMNGIFRGKWLPPHSAGKLASNEIRLPISTYALDIWGEDVDATGLASPIGDPDGIGVPLLHTLSMIPWSKTPAAQVLMTLQLADGSPCVYDPRQQLAKIIGSLAEMGLRAVVAPELEFYLFQPRPNTSDAPVPPDGNRQSQLYALDTMSDFEPVLNDIRAACEAFRIPADTIIAEFGPGQFEINFKHADDALKAADHAILFKRIVGRTANAHGLEATFLAKPYGALPGSGMHMHVSLRDDNDQSIFSSDGNINVALSHAIGGCLATMADCQAIFAPNLNSFRRFGPGTHAPAAINWGLDNRNASVRVPTSSGPGARLEHRLAGADANPYLALTAILGGMLIGLQDKIAPPPAIEAVGTSSKTLSANWSASVQRFAASGYAARIFGTDYQRVYAACKNSEIETLNAKITDVEYDTYLSRL